MAKTQNIRGLVNYIKTTKSAVFRGFSLAFLQAIEGARGEAIKNAKKNFTGRMGRKLSGRLINSIFAEVDVPSKGSDKVPSGSLGTRGIPYGAIHEFGGGIDPVNAKHLWVKVNHKGKFKRLTPTEFFELRKKEQLRGKARTRLKRKGLAGPDRKTGASRAFKKRKTFDVFESRKGNLIAAEVTHLKTKVKVNPLFALKDHVDIPERPYIRPAIRKSFRNFREIASFRIAQEFVKGR